VQTARAKTSSFDLRGARRFPLSIHLLGLLFFYVSTVKILYPSIQPSFYDIAWIEAFLVHALPFFLFFPAFLFSFPLFSGRTNQAQFKRAQFHWGMAFLAFVSFWVAIAFKVPLRIAFLTIKPALERSIARTASNPPNMATDIISPYHRISAEITNRAHDWYHSDNINTGLVFFFLGSDKESAFIYSPKGIKGLSYNSGSCGHLIGPWYWMTED
jgi:hypothetical protein